MKLGHAIFIAVGVAAVAGSAIAGPLDAPVRPRAPTVGSEIHRGADAAIACHELSPITNLDGYRGCIDAAHNQNRQAMGTGYAAFDAGLYFKEAQTLGIVLKVLSSHADVSLLRMDADLADALYHSARNEVGVTDDQVRVAAFSG